MTERRHPPKVEHTPGLTWLPRKNGWEARWVARRDLVKRGYLPKSRRLWAGEAPTEVEQALISDQCMSLQSEMLVWGRGGIPEVTGFDGTIRGLSRCYQTDQDSGYRKLRYASRRHYDRLLRRLETDYGDERIIPNPEDLDDRIKARHFLRWYDGWVGEEGCHAMGHSLIGILRTLLSFGVSILEDSDCARLSGALSKQRFKGGRPRKERITAEQATALREVAHQEGLPSIALAQAFQFENIMRQKDVIGEWVPISEPGTSDVTWSTTKWLRGLRWSEISHDLIMTHNTSKKGKDLVVNLLNAPMVMEEIDLLGGVIPPSGPVIVYEVTGRPYEAWQYRKEWRRLARMTGIPDCVFNMDSRAGGISEATDAGADLEHVRHAATHSDIQTTQRYSRNQQGKTAEVQKKRIAYRNKSGTED